MWQEVGVAALVGVALSDSWMCLFMGASFGAADRRLSWGFLVGRTVGLMALLLLIGLLGASLLPSKTFLTIVFAASTIAVAIVLAYSVVRPTVLGGCHHSASTAPDGGSPDGCSQGGCPDGCGGCPDDAKPGEGGPGENGSPEGGHCGHVPGWLRERMAGRSPWAAGMTIGGFRGAMPCLKVLIIIPLLVASPPVTVVLMAAAFTLTSTIYPLIGLVSGSTLTRYMDQSKRLRLAAAAGVAAVGIVTIIRFYQRTCDLW